MHSAIRLYDQTDADRMRPVLADAIAVVRHRIHRPWPRAWKSQAADDLAATRNLPRWDPRTTWGESPVSTVIPVVQMLLDAAVQHVQAVQLLLERGGDVILAIDAEARAALEAGGQIWWLLGRGITGRQRVARLYAQRRATALELEKVLDKMGEGAAIGYGPMPAELDNLYKTELGLKVKRHPDETGVLQWSSSEGQRMPSYTDRVRAFVRDGLGHSPDAGLYAFYCGAAHSEMWRIQYGYVEQTNSDGTTTFNRRAVAASISMATGVALGALVYAAARAYEYMGDGAGLAELHLRLSDLRNATRAR